jgi:hypothetical protein
MTASIAPAMDNPWGRQLASGRAPFGDFVGVTNATLNTSSLFNHNLRNYRNEPTVPTRVMLTINQTSPAGFIYEFAGGHTATQCDVRGTAASLVFRARAWL